MESVVQVHMLMFFFYFSVIGLLNEIKAPEGGAESDEDKKVGQGCREEARG